MKWKLNLSALLIGCSCTFSSFATLNSNLADLIENDPDKELILAQCPEFAAAVIDSKDVLAQEDEISEQSEIVVIVDGTEVSDIEITEESEGVKITIVLDESESEAKEISNNEKTIHSLYAHELMNSYYLNEEKLPLVISPIHPDLTYEECLNWAYENRAGFEKLLRSEIGILFRGFPVKTAEQFAEFLEFVLDKGLNDYKGGEGSRTKVAEGVYTSTEAPAKYKIPLHNELSCTKNPPNYICFFCEVAPQAGTGQTLLGKTDDVSITMSHKLFNNQSLYNLFATHQIKYISRHPPKGSFFTRVNPTHRSWQDVFETEDPAKVERICKAKGYECKWDYNWAVITRLAPAIRPADRFIHHPYWFNQFYLYHANAYIRGGRVNDFLANLLYIDPSTKQYDVEFANGQKIPDQAAKIVYQVLDDATVKFDWQKDDILILNNITGLHGRAPYKGERRILVSLIQ